MAKTEIPEITEVQRISLQPGDKIAVRLPEAIRADQAQRVKEHVAAVLGIGEGRVLVLANGIDLTVVTP